LIPFRLRLTTQSWKHKFHRLSPAVRHHLRVQPACHRTRTRSPSRHVQLTTANSRMPRHQTTCMMSEVTTSPFVLHRLPIAILADLFRAAQAARASHTRRQAACRVALATERARGAVLPCSRSRASSANETIRPLGRLMCAKARRNYPADIGVRREHRKRH
jgi:hypothetical protein